MIRQQLERHLRSAEYYSLPSILPEFSAYAKVENSFLNVVFMIEYKNTSYLTSDQYLEMKKTIRNFFNSNYRDVHIMSLVLYEDINRAKAFVKEDPFCWFLSSITKELQIDEDRVEDFYGLKGFLNDFLKDFEEEPDYPDEIHSEEETNSFLKRQLFYLLDAPRVTVVLVLINIMLFILCRYYGDFLYSKGQIGLIYIQKKEYYRLLSAMFLHADLRHLSSNMILLYFMGDMLERIISKSDFIIVFFFSGIVGNVVSCLYENFSGNSMISIGASGAIYGLIGCLFYLVIRKKPELNISISRMLFMLAYCIYSSLVGTNINVVAHLGGLVAGFVIMWLISNRRQKA